jgi:glycerol-3-phosphate acyltransferase PlsY
MSGILQKCSLAPTISNDNVLRSSSKGAAIFTLSGDALKGLVAVLLAQWATNHYKN